MAGTGRRAPDRAHAAPDPCPRRAAGHDRPVAGRRLAVRRHAAARARSTTATKCRRCDGSRGAWRRWRACDERSRGASAVRGPSNSFSRNARALLHVRRRGRPRRACASLQPRHARPRTFGRHAGRLRRRHARLDRTRPARACSVSIRPISTCRFIAPGAVAALPGLDVSQLVERRRGSVRFGDFRSASCAASASNASRCRAASRASACIVRRRTRSSIAREHGTTIPRLSRR